MLQGFLCLQISFHLPHWTPPQASNVPSFQSHPHAINSAKEGVKSGEVTDSTYIGALTNQARLLHFVGGSAANGAEQAHLATAIHVGQHVEVFAQRLAPHAWVDSSVLLQTQSRTELPGRPLQPVRSNPHIPPCRCIHHGAAPPQGTPDARARLTVCRFRWKQQKRSP